MTQKNPDEYRPCVGLMIINDAGRVFVGKRIDSHEGDYWQMPQGGIDPGEEMLPAAMRELFEETGLTEDKVELIAEAPAELLYELPPELEGKLWGGRYKGQRQRWLLLRLTGTDADVRLDAHDPPEFCDFKWVDPEELPGLIVPFKERIYRAVLDAFRERI